MVFVSLKPFVVIKGLHKTRHLNCDVTYNVYSAIWSLREVREERWLW